jgi:hypothetical protein
MNHRTGTNHVEVDVGEAAEQVRAAVHRGGMIAIFPESTLSTLTPVVNDHTYGAIPGSP